MLLDKIDVVNVRLEDLPSFSEVLASEEEFQGRKLSRSEKKKLRKRYKFYEARAKKNEPKKRSRLVKYLTKGRTNRTAGGTIGLLLFVAIFGSLSIFPVLFVVGRAFMPLSDLFRFPPLFLPNNPTLDNFKSLWIYSGESLVPFSRYLFNTIFIVVLGSVGHVAISSMAAYPLAKYKFPGNHFLSDLIVYSLMFSPTVTAAPTYFVMNAIGLIDTPWAIIFPALASTIGLYLLQNFMTQIPDALIESAQIDGASPWKQLWAIIMPAVKPAWITAFIFSFQALWSNNGGSFIYTESKKPLSFMLQQIAAAGVARTGVAAAATLLMFIIPVIVFVVTQSNILETMTTSGLKE
ncbi:carbohydrate ABC transporter permease [Fastidiosipila sanguinis]|uniref:Carbohydrate ABC transporter permease n=1 Tax=Fastidiosipila sanguinis TaxID=236753 RepID=A0A2S0KNF1_9FIRM|nr:carbohydrate ABC transporter permease [Fastidiosipila sanguinis]AVM42560.1 carbohydrate ABC transporter permease [Fastidiosipila sanguinis]